MAIRLNIDFTGNVSTFDHFTFSIENDPGTPPFEMNADIVFVPGTPTNQNQSKAGLTTQETIDSLAAILTQYHSYGKVQYTAETNRLVIDVFPVGNYGYYVTDFPSVMDINPESYTVPIETISPLLEIDDVVIEIYDTYDNDRPLIDEFTQVSSPKLSWDSGDDIYEPLMSSKLTFNMLVPDAADAKFLHLFTGNETRYRVEVHSVNDALEKQMIWQGFLLPDLQREPYTNGVFFVEFTAVDMIASLKGRTMMPWFYNNRIPIVETIAYCLQFSGITQDIIVSPSIVPANNYLTWADLNIPLLHYVDGVKFTDCYTILMDILSANQLMLYSYRGYWFIKGVTRKGEVINQNSFYFDAYGKFIKYIHLENKVSAPMQVRETPVVYMLTPWKKVSVQVDQKTQSSILPDDVVVLKNEYLKDINETNPQYKASFSTEFYNYFNAVAELYRLNVSSDAFKYAFNKSFYSEYHVNEATALSNYFECKLKPYIAAGTEYEIDFEAIVDIYVYGQASTENFGNIQESAKYGFVFQLFVDDVEIVSNRPSFYDAKKYYVTYENLGLYDQASIANKEGLGRLSYKIKNTFISNLDGYLTVRILFPIYEDTDPPLKRNLNNLHCTKLSIAPISEFVEQDANAYAVRAIDFTQEYDQSIALTCSTNELILNNMGINKPIQVNYFKSVNFIGPQISKTIHQNIIKDNGVVELTGVVDYKYNLISPKSFDDVFGYKKLKKNLFLTRDNGDIEVFDDVIGRKSDYDMAYISSKSLKPITPKNYSVYNIASPPATASDRLKYMNVEYNQEVMANRNYFKIEGLSAVKSFVKTMADAIHYVRPETTFKLETTFFSCVFPNELIEFEYNGVARHFIPTRLDIDLVSGKTAATTIESKFTVLSDISYE